VRTCNGQCQEAVSADAYVFNILHCTAPDKNNEELASIGENEKLRLHFLTENNREEMKIPLVFDCLSVVLDLDIIVHTILKSHCDVVLVIIVGTLSFPINKSYKTRFFI
jgi:hypothetical protein